MASSDNDNAKAGVDFEWVNSNAKDSKGNPVKTRRFFTRAEKAAIKAGKKPETKPAKAPAKAPTKPAKSNNTVRPEGKAAGMPAAKRGTNSVRPGDKPAGMPARKGASNLDRKISAGALGAVSGVAAVGAARNAGVSARGVAARVGAPFRRIGPGGRARSDMDKARDPLMLMNKGGVVKKKK